MKNTINQRINALIEKHGLEYLWENHGLYTKEQATYDLEQDFNEDTFEIANGEHDYYLLSAFGAQAINEDNIEQLEKVGE